MSQPVSLQIRTPWQVMRSVVTALMIRDIQRKFITSVNTNRSIGFLWIFLEPMIHVAVWTAIRLFYGIHGAGNLSTPVFILLGAIPFLMVRTVQKCTPIINQNKGIFVFRQIKPPDIVLSLVLSEGLVMLIVYCLLLTGLWWLGSKWTLFYPLQFASAFIAFVMFLLGWGLVFAVAGFFFRFLTHFWLVFMRVLYMTSGIFFPADSIPPAMREYFAMNPLFQVIELSRESFTQVRPSLEISSMTYLWQCAVFSLLFGMFVYLAFRDKIMTEIEQR